MSLRDYRPHLSYSPPPSYGPYGPAYGAYAGPPAAPPRASGPPATVLVAFWAVLGQIAVYLYRTWIAVHDPDVQSGRAQINGITFTGDSAHTVVTIMWVVAGVGALILLAMAARMKNGGGASRFLLAAGGVITVVTTAGHLGALSGTAQLLGVATVVLAALTALGCYGPGSARWYRR